MSRVSTHVLRLGAAAAALSLLVSAGGTKCGKFSNGCFSRTTLKEYTGQPSVPCQIGHPVVQITSSAFCAGGTGGPVVLLRCGVSTEGFSYTGSDGTVHTFGTTTNWETVMNSDCLGLTYSAS